MTDHTPSPAEAVMAARALGPDTSALLLRLAYSTTEPKRRRDDEADAADALHDRGLAVYVHSTGRWTATERGWAVAGALMALRMGASTATVLRRIQAEATVPEPGGPELAAIRSLTADGLIRSDDPGRHLVSEDGEWVLAVLAYLDQEAEVWVLRVLHELDQEADVPEDEDEPLIVPAEALDTEGTSALAGVAQGHQPEDDDGARRLAAAGMLTHGPLGWQLTPAGRTAAEEELADEEAMMRRAQARDARGLQRRAAAVMADLMEADLPPGYWTLQMPPPHLAHLYADGTGEMLIAHVSDEGELRQWAEHHGAEISRRLPRYPCIRLTVRGISVRLYAPAAEAGEEQ